MRLCPASRVSLRRLFRERRRAPQYVHRLREGLNRSRGARKDTRRLGTCVDDRRRVPFNIHNPIQIS